MASMDEHACQNYVSLKTEKTTCGELVRLLFSPDIGKRKFIKCSEEEGQKPREFRRRWLIFVSIVMQRTFIFFKHPLARMGVLFVHWLNLVSANGGLFMLFTNRLKGKLKKPDSLSTRSVLGYLDWRMELDNDIKPSNTRYKGALSIMAAKLSYENQTLIQAVVQDHWKMKFVKSYKFWNGYLKQDSTQAFIFQDAESDPSLIVVAFRGTDPFDADAWRTDFDISWCQFPNIGKTHRGFMKALGMQKHKSWPLELEPKTVYGGQRHHQYAYYTIRDKLMELLQKHKNAKFILTGHSLGGALAVMFTAVLAMHDGNKKYKWLIQRLEGVYTFGQPRVGDKKFGGYMEEKLDQYGVNYMRYVYSNDMVPRVPYDDKTLLFKHFGKTLYFNSFYKGKVLKEEPNKNYFSVLWIIPKRLNAVWELIRSFILPLRRGSQYREGWFMRVFRVIGLVIPGLAAHAPQDYVNITRLGSIPKID